MSNNIEKPEREIDRTRVAEGTCLSDNGLFAYEKYLDFPTEDFFSKRVLDIGAGFGERFNIEAGSQGIEVISLNPELKRERSREARRQVMKSKHAEIVRSVSGLVQEMSFKDKSFEAVTSLYGVPRYLERSKKEYEEAFKEIIRVLKPGGKAYIYPIDHEQVEGKNVVELIEDIELVESLEVFKKDHRGVTVKKGLIITKKS